MSKEGVEGTGVRAGRPRDLVALPEDLARIAHTAVEQLAFRHRPIMHETLWIVRQVPPDAGLATRAHLTAHSSRGLSAWPSAAPVSVSA